MPNTELEHQLFTQGFRRVIGIDEVGRGCLAGPVAMGAFAYYPNTPALMGVNDSKLVSPAEREVLWDDLSAQEYKIYYGAVEHINSLGLAAVLHDLLAQIIADFHDESTYFLVDGYFKTSLPQTSRMVIKGDMQHYSIAAASVLAKVERDRLMQKLDEQFPGYSLFKHKGYATVEHRRAIQKLGPSAAHRTSFRLEWSNEF